MWLAVLNSHEPLPRVVMQVVGIQKKTGPVGLVFLFFLIFLSAIVGVLRTVIHIKTRTSHAWKTIFVKWSSDRRIMSGSAEYAGTMNNEDRKKKNVTFRSD